MNADIRYQLQVDHPTLEELTAQHQRSLPLSRRTERGQFMKRRRNSMSNLDTTPQVRRVASLKSGSYSDAWKMPCMYVGIRDANNMHVLEYAVDERGARPSVRYARIHKYIEGSSVDDWRVTRRKPNWRLMWLDKPSEDILYFRGPFDSRGGAPSSPLQYWSSPGIEVVSDRDCSPLEEDVSKSNVGKTLQINQVADLRRTQPSLFPAGIAEVQHMRRQRAKNYEPRFTTTRPCAYIVHRDGSIYFPSKRSRYSPFEEV